MDVILRTPQPHDAATASICIVIHHVQNAFHTYCLMWSLEQPVTEKTEA